MNKQQATHNFITRNPLLLFFFFVSFIFSGCSKENPTKSTEKLFSKQLTISDPIDGSSAIIKVSCNDSTYIAKCNADYFNFITNEIQLNEYNSEIPVEGNEDCGEVQIPTILTTLYRFKLST